jgi:hypothetical protein
LRRSLNEIAGELKKAARGAGYPVGIAEDVASAGAALVACGQDGVGAVLAALEIGDGAGNAPTLTTAGGFGTIRAASHGPSVMDVLVAMPQPAVLEVGLVDQPVFMAGLAVNAAVNNGLSITIEFSGSCRVLAKQGNFQITGDMISQPCGLVLRSQIAEPQTSPAEPQENGYQVNENAWQAIKLLSAKTCVPASEASRIHGAGAQINDND